MAPRGVHDPYQGVTISAQNARQLAAFYQKKLRQFIVTPKERAWWTSRLNECLRFLRVAPPLKAKAAELRKKAVVARAKKKYAQAADFDAQAARLERDAVAWTTDGDGFVAPKEEDGEASVEASVDASLSVDTPWYTSWWIWGLGIAGAVGIALYSRGGKGRKASGGGSASSSTPPSSSPSTKSFAFRRKV